MKRLHGSLALIVLLSLSACSLLRPGAHTYEFVFRPASAYVGMAISGLTVALCLALCAPGVKRDTE